MQTLSDDWNDRDDRRISWNRHHFYSLPVIESRNKIMPKCSHRVWVLFETREVRDIKFSTWYYVFEELFYLLDAAKSREKEDSKAPSRLDRLEIFMKRSGRSRQSYRNQDWLKGVYCKFRYLICHSWKSYSTLLCCGFLQQDTVTRPENPRNWWNITEYWNIVTGNMWPQLFKKWIMLSAG